jgi:hypothetical protein
MLMKKLGQGRAGGFLAEQLSPSVHITPESSSWVPSQRRYGSLDTMFVRHQIVLLASFSSVPHSAFGSNLDQFSF